MLLTHTVSRTDSIAAHYLPLGVGMGKILYYKRLTRKLRAQQGLPQLMDEDDLPDPMYDPDYVHVLSDKQQDELHYQQLK